MNKALSIVNDDAALVADARKIVEVSQGTSEDKEQMAKDLADKSNLLNAMKLKSLEVVPARIITSQ